MQPSTKAGLLGAAVLSVLISLNAVAYLLPGDSQIVGCFCTCLPYLAASVAVGVLAAHWSTTPRSAACGAQAGLTAGLLAGGIACIWNTIFTLLVSSSGLAERLLAQLPPEQLAALNDSGLGVLLTPIGMALTTLLCEVPIVLIWSVTCAALAGAAYAGLFHGEQPGQASTPDLTRWA
jgi:hypothetical protein